MLGTVMPEKLTLSRWARVAALTLLSLAALGCAARPKLTCERVELVALKIAPNAHLNQDREGYPRSVVLRIFQLRGEKEFRKTTFDEVWPATATESRGRSVVEGPDEVVVIPGKRETHFLERKEQATHVAIAANFREHQQDSGWRAVTELPPPSEPLCRKQARVAAYPLKIQLVDYSLRAR
jgi:type VI secretion system VasD/TssJ family lipoprotein